MRLLSKAAFLFYSPHKPWWKSGLHQYHDWSEALIIYLLYTKYIYMGAQVNLHLIPSCNILLCHLADTVDAHLDD